MRLASRIAVLAGSLALASVAHAGPSKQELAKQQLEYAKQLYAEGLAAMEAQDYSTALKKFEDAYRYAPDKHLFNYNIGMAALLGRNCNRAKSAFQYFLASVKEHPERATAEAKLAEIESSGCADSANPADEEDEGTLETAPVGKLKDREQAREQEQRNRLLTDALAEVRESKALYQEVAKRGKARPFPGIARQKKRAEKKLVKLMGSYEVHVPAPSAATSSLPGDLKKACEKAIAREKSAAKQYGRVLDGFDEVDVYRLFSRLQKASNNRFVKQLEDCAYGKK